MSEALCSLSGRAKAFVAFAIIAWSMTTCTMSPAFAAKSGAPSPAFMARFEKLTQWVVAHTSYKAAEPPRVLFLDQATINYIYYGQAKIRGDGVLAAYNDGGLMFLPTTFTLGRDDYLLVHEIVHHLQAHSDADFKCRAEREKEAYETQIKFVDETGVGEKPSGLFMLMLNRCDMPY
jgi:hypothetical protein